MQEQEITRTVNQWYEWSKQQQYQSTNLIESLHKKFTNCFTLFLTGDEQKAGVLLDQLLDETIFSEILGHVGNLSVEIKYGSTKRIAVMVDQKSIDMEKQTFIKLIKSNSGPLFDTKRKIEKLTILLPNVRLKTRTIVYQKLQERHLAIQPHHFPWILVVTGDWLSDLQQKFIQHIALFERTKSWISTSTAAQLPKGIQQIANTEVLSVMHEIQTIPADFIQHELSSLLFSMTEKFQAYGDKLVSNALQPYIAEKNILNYYESNIDHKLQRFNSQVVKYNELLLALLKLDQLEIQSVEGAAKVAQYLQSIIKTVNIPALEVKADNLLSQIKGDLAQKFTSFKAAFSVFCDKASQDNTRMRELQDKWQEVKNPYYFFGKLNAYEKEVVSFNQSLFEINGLYKEMLKSKKRLEDEIMTTENMLNDICKALVQHIQLLKAQIESKFISVNEQKMYFKGYQHTNVQLQPEIDFLKGNLNYITKLSKLIDTADDHERKLQQLVVQVEKTLEPAKINMVERYETTPIQFMNESVPAFNRLHVEMNLPNKELLEASLPQQIKLNLTDYQYKIAFRRYKINAGIFLVGLLTGGFLLFGTNQSFANFDLEKNHISDYINLDFMDDEESYDDAYTDEETFYSEENSSDEQAYSELYATDEGTYDDQSYTESYETEDEYYSDESYTQEEWAEEEYYDEDYSEDTGYVDNEWEIVNFIGGFRETYQAALNEQNFSIVADYFYEGSATGEEYEKYVNSVSRTDYYDFLSTNVYYVEEMATGEYQAYSQEVFDYYNNDGEMTHYVRDKVYDIQNVDGYLKIMSISINDTVRE